MSSSAQVESTLTHVRTGGVLPGWSMMRMRSGGRRRHRLVAVLVAASVVSGVVAASPGTSEAAVTELVDCRFSRAQVFDVQWNPGLDGNTLLRASSFALPYASNEPGSRRLTAGEIGDGDSFGFYRNGSEVGFRQYASDGSLIRTLHLRGTFVAVGEDFLFYNGNGSWGTLITSGTGYDLGGRADLAVSDASVTLEEALAYSSCASVPLAPGQTRAEVLAGGGGPVATVPGAPEIVTVTTGSGSLTVEFAPPASDGGAAITNYAYSTDGGTTWTARDPAATASPLTITGLTDGTPYTIALRAINSAGDGTPATSGPHTPVAPPPDTSELDEAVALIVERTPTLTPVDGLLVRDGQFEPTTASFERSGTTGGVVIEDDAGTLRVTVTGDRGVTPSSGVTVSPDGEIVCEICADLAAGSVVEAWVFSTPRLAAAVRVDVDIEEGGCLVLRVPVGGPLDGAGPIPPGAHALHLRMYTVRGLEVLAVPIGVGTGTGTVLPTRIETGGGPMPVVPLPLGVSVALAAALLIIVEQQRTLARTIGSNERRRARARYAPGRRLTGFDQLASRLAEARAAQRSG